MAFQLKFQAENVTHLKSLNESTNLRVRCAISFHVCNESEQLTHLKNRPLNAVTAWATFACCNKLLSVLGWQFRYNAIEAMCWLATQTPPPE
jgi:hypothetical protein